MKPPNTPSSIAAATVDKKADEPSLYTMTLYPHRSLSKDGVKWIIGLLVLICAGAGLRFWAVGAWPVVIFVFIDIFAIWLAFKLNFRSGKIREIIKLTKSRLYISRIQPDGQTETWHFEPYWTQIGIKTIDGEPNCLTIGSHGNEVILGKFLIPSERISAANELQIILAKWKSRTLE